MHYNKFIQVNEKFQTSINLQLDLNKLIKLNSYIPTKQSVEILNLLLKTVYYNNGDRASVLVGPYGRGKSHLLLTLLSILSLEGNEIDSENKLNADEVINNLRERVNCIDSDTEKLIKEVRVAKKLILPVIINSNYEDLNQAFLLAIKDALNRAGLDDLIANTYFDSALVMIEKWEKDFPETYKKFEDVLKMTESNVYEMKKHLKKCSFSAYALFKNCYPTVTSGSEFNPLINTDVIKLYNSINTVLCEEKHYRGIMIVFDEFSKFLEGASLHSISKDLKLVQDMAELAVRSGTNQIHFICVTHKEIADYASKQKISDSFRTVEGRFRHIRYTASSEQSYELIANAIVKSEKIFDKFLRVNQAAFDEVKFHSHNTGAFSDILDNTENIYEEVIVKGCYPLNPLSAYTLLRISEKVAQNERTLFTFLSKKEKYSLSEFLDKKHETISFLTVDWIFDYFVEIFRKEVFNKNIHTIWSKCESAIKQTKATVQIKILKAIAIIYMIADDKLKPTSAHIKTCLFIDDIEFEVAITALEKNHILHKRKSDSYYVFLTANGIDVQKQINDTKETKILRVNRSEMLKQIIDLSYILPRRYNDDYSMIRYFENRFIDATELLSIPDSAWLFKNADCDGFVLNVLMNGSVNADALIEHLKQLNDIRILLCIPDSHFGKDEELREFFSIKELKRNIDYENDDKMQQELLIYEEDCVQNLSRYIEKMYYPGISQCKYYTKNGETATITKPLLLNRVVSDICFESYSQTPKINNEMINKNQVTTPIKKARMAIVESLFHQATIGIIDREGLGADVSVYRSTIINKGIEGSSCSNDDGLNDLLDLISNFIKRNEGVKKSFVELYQQLADKPFGVRKGIIPIYLGYVLKEYQNNIYFYYMNKEIPLSAELLEKINESPDKHYILLQPGTCVKEQYVSGLGVLFQDHINKNISYINKVYQVVAAMQNWLRSLPKITREFTLIQFVERDKTVADKGLIAFRSALNQYDVNARELLFDFLPEGVFDTSDLNECYTKTKFLKDQLDSFLYNFKTQSANQIKELFEKGYMGELSQAGYFGVAEPPILRQDKSGKGNAFGLKPLEGT